MTAFASAVVIAKRPVPGLVKTRLVPPLTYAQAAAVAGAALRDTLDAVASLPAHEHILAFDGATAGWLPPGWRAVAQPSGGLDARLAAAFDAVGPGPSVLVGMDTPQLEAAALAVFDPSAYDACLGMAPDGGYWAIGFADPTLARPAITGVPMSTSHTGARQLERLQSVGLRVQLLDVLTDVDTIESAREVAATAPATRFAARLRRCTTPLQRAG